MGKLSGIFQGDRVVWFVFFALCAVSVVEVFSALSTLTYRSGSFVAPIARHATFLVMGFVIVLALHRVPYRFFKVFFLVLPIAALLLILLLAGKGETLNDGARWIRIFGIPLQPSELAKGSLVVYTAAVLGWNQETSGALPGTFRRIAIPTALICGLIFPENLSTAALLFAVIVAMMIVGRVPWATIGKMLGVLLTAALIGAASLLSLSDGAARKVGSLPGCKRVPTWKSRLEKIAGGDTLKVTPRTFDIDGDAQIGHSKIAIASSNIIGCGPGNSVQRDFLPQAYSDFIYAVIVEELGLVGAVVVIGLYILLLFRVGHIVRRFPGGGFGPFLALGLALLLVTQAMLNMMVATDFPMVPVTGQPLPLVSRGGTSTLVNCIYIGMILSVSRAARKHELRRLAEEAEKAAAGGDGGDGGVSDNGDVPPAEVTAKELEALANAD